MTAYRCPVCWSVDVLDNFCSGDVDRPAHKPTSRVLVRIVRGRVR